MPGVFAFHCPNGGKRSKIEASIFKGLGVKAGIPDVLIFYRAQIFGLELKAEYLSAVEDKNIWNSSLDPKSFENRCFYFRTLPAIRAMKGKYARHRSRPNMLE